jgi:two-component system, response regulator, stage 0 sporulation protein F
MRKLKLLIVDDIFTNRLLLSEIISEIGCEFVQTENGKEAIKALEKENFDLILMDIEMPVMNGLETTRYIRTKFPEPKKKVPIIALTAHNPYSFFDDFNDAGFNSLITKPYSVDKVTEIITSLGMEV